MVIWLIAFPCSLQHSASYFIAANPAVERHLYSVPLPTRTELEAYRSASRPVPKATPLTDTKKPGFYDVSFSPQAGFYLLNQRNGLPWQRVYKVGDSSEWEGS